MNLRGLDGRFLRKPEPIENPIRGFAKAAFSFGRMPCLFLAFPSFPAVSGFFPVCQPVSFITVFCPVRWFFRDTDCALQPFPSGRPIVQSVSNEAAGGGHPDGFLPLKGSFFVFREDGARGRKAGLFHFFDFWRCFPGTGPFPRVFRTAKATEKKPAGNKTKVPDKSGRCRLHEVSCPSWGNTTIKKKQNKYV